MESFLPMVGPWNRVSASRLMSTNQVFVNIRVYTHEGTLKYSVAFSEVSQVSPYYRHLLSVFYEKFAHYNTNRRISMPQQLIKSFS